MSRKSEADVDRALDKSREEATEREIQSRVDQGASRDDATKDAVREQADRDRSHDEYVKSSWGR